MPLLVSHAKVACSPHYSNTWITKAFLTTRAELGNTTANAFLLLQVHVLYPPFLDDPRQQYISGNAGKSIRWQDIHGGKLKLPGLARPSRRLCGFHAALAIQNAEVQGWVPKGSVVLPDTAWDSPNCDKQLMQQFLNGLDLCGARRLQMSEAAEDDSVDEADM